MIQEETSYDFSSFNSVKEKEIFVKNLIKKTGWAVSDILSYLPQQPNSLYTHGIDNIPL